MKSKKNNNNNSQNSTAIKQTIQLENMQICEKTFQQYKYTNDK